VKHKANLARHLVLLVYSFLVSTLGPTLNLGLLRARNGFNAFLV